MRNRRTLAGGAAFALLAMTAGLGSAAIGEAARPDCRSRGTTITANERACVFYIGDRDQHVVHLCALRSRRSTRLGSFGSEIGGVLNFRLAGGWVAYERALSRRGLSDSRVESRSLGGTRRRRSELVHGVVSNVPDMELKRNGSIAWVWRIDGVPQVRKLDADGEAVLDSGTEIDERSLALSDSTLYWTKGGQPFSTQLR
jgi:hypothetical protein